MQTDAFEEAQECHAAASVLIVISEWVSCQRRREMSLRDLCEWSRDVRALRGEARRSGSRTTVNFDREGHASPSLEKNRRRGGASQGR